MFRVLIKCILHLFDVGPWLARTIAHSISELEKNDCREYTVAILLLQYLLSLKVPVLIHQRGKWYDRLCIDLEHNNMHARALEVALCAQDDISVKVLKHNNAMQSNTIQYNTIQYNTIQYNTVQCNTIHQQSSICTWYELFYLLCVSLLVRVCVFVCIVLDSPFLAHLLALSMTMK